MVLNVEINQDRALSSPSPTANLAGIWKGYDSDHKPPVFCRRFFYFPSLEPLDCGMTKKSYI
jgi:hypothetical protein